MAGQRRLPAAHCGVAMSLRQSLRRLVAFATARWAFRTPPSTTKRLRAFAAAERNSELELLLAAHQTHNDERRLSYLRHALDEARHAEAFFRRAHGDDAALFPDVDVDDLYERLGERDFLALVFVGEGLGAAQFRGYAEAWGSHGPGRLFSAITRDEDRHERDAWQHLVQLCDGDVAHARRRVRAMAVWMAWRRLHRSGRAVSSTLFAACMTLVFFACAPLALWVKRMRPTPTGWKTT
jgi:hypothetical protein